MAKYIQFGSNGSLLMLLTAFLLLVVSSADAYGQITMTVSVDPTLESKVGPASGRLLIFMRKDDGKPTDGFGADQSDPEAVWVHGSEVTGLSSSLPATLYPDSLAFPSAFSSVPLGRYQIFALLDRDHSYTYSGPGAGDLYSEVVRTEMPAASVQLRLYRSVPDRKIDVPSNFRLVEFDSPMLSAFWGRPVKMKASVLLPPGYATSKKRYPTIYSISGYGGSHLNPLRGAAAREKEMLEGKRPEMITVFLEAQHSLGHHVFADSVNNGPWGTALVKEFIPYLEKQFRMDGRPAGRLLTGHSSGGWSSLWTMVRNPDFFGGTWSTSPDPVDFRDFTGPNIYENANAYVDSKGNDFVLVRARKGKGATLRQYAQQERVVGTYGGQMAAFNAVFSPRGADGQPMRLFDLGTGKIDPAVARLWEKYDISLILRRNWRSLGPKLRGKINIWVGTADTFHLDNSLRLLDAELKKLGSDARITFVDGKDHFDLFSGGLMEEMQWEMYRIARPNSKPKVR